MGVPFVLFSLAIPIIDAAVERCSQSAWIRALENHKTETQRRAHRIYKVFFFRFANGVFPLLVESFGARLIQLYGYGSNLMSGDQLAQQQDDALIALWLQLLSCVFFSFFSFFFFSFFFSFFFLRNTTHVWHVWHTCVSCLFIVLPLTICPVRSFPPSFPPRLASDAQVHGRPASYEYTGEMAAFVMDETPHRKD